MRLLGGEKKALHKFAVEQYHVDDYQDCCRITLS